MTHTFIIAEAGSNHEGSLTNALDLVDAAKDSGADAVKFQYWSDPERLARRRHAHEACEMFRKYAMPQGWLPDLFHYCKARDIEFMCTVYLPEDIEVVAPFLKRFKIASFEAGDAEFIKTHYQFNKPIIVSTGMVDHPTKISWGLRPRVSFLHCVSAYPAPVNEASLGCLQTHTFQGFSDHTTSRISGAVAVAAGAEILEKHFKLHSTSSKAPDYWVSLMPGELKKYIANVREAELLLGDGEKKVQPSEQENVKFKVK